MVHHLAMRMRDFHALGYVHRDLKPGNVMWLPRENRWTVIDFGCAARTGEQARLGFSIAYAAPEVISAYRTGAHSMVAQVRTRHDMISIHYFFLTLLDNCMGVEQLKRTHVAVQLRCLPFQPCVAFCRRRWMCGRWG